VDVVEAVEHDDFVVMANLLPRCCCRRGGVRAVEMLLQYLSLTTGRDTKRNDDVNDTVAHVISAMNRMLRCDGIIMVVVGYS